MTTAARPLRVAFFGNFLSASRGGRSASEDLADRLEARGAQVTRASVHVAPARRLADMLLTAARERRRYDVAHVDVFSHKGFIWAEAVCALLRTLGKPYVLTLHGGQLPEFAAAHPRRVRRLLGSARAVVAPSRYMSEAMREYAAGIAVIANAIDVERYHARVREAAAPSLVWLRSFHAIYNPVLAVRALAALLARVPDARLVMAGPDKGDGSRDAVVAEAARLGVGGRVELVGNVPNAGVPALLDRHDILINTTDIDNTPISLMEAMASGLCIVTTNVGGIPVLCRDRETAVLVPPRDPDAMAAACAEVIATPELAHRLSANGVREAASFDRARVIERWEQTLRASGRPA